MSTPGEIETLISEFTAWLKEKYPTCYAALKPGAGEDALADVSAATGLALPDELSEILRLHNGQELTIHLFEGWFLLDTNGIKENRQSLMKYDERWNPEWLPFAADLNGNYLYLDTVAAQTPVYSYYHDEPEPTMQHGSSMAAWLKPFVRECQLGVYGYSEEYGGIADIR